MVLYEVVIQVVQDVFLLIFFILSFHQVKWQNKKCSLGSLSSKHESPNTQGSPGPTEGTLIYSKSLICKWEYGGPKRRDGLWKPHSWSFPGGRAESSFLILAPLWGHTEVPFWHQHWPNLLWAWASAFKSRITKHPILRLFLSSLPHMWS